MDLNSGPLRPEEDESCLLTHVHPLESLLHPNQVSCVWLVMLFVSLFLVEPFLMLKRRRISRQQMRGSGWFLFAKQIGHTLSSRKSFLDLHAKFYQKNGITASGLF